MSSQKNRVLVALSGGRDSAVVAALLKNQGFDLVGLHLRVSDGSERANQFRSRCVLRGGPAAEERVRKLCSLLEIPLVVEDMVAAFEAEVIDPFVHTFMQHRRPNACVNCNRQIRFNAAFKKADELGISQVATGHYAQISKDGTGTSVRLLSSIDADRDQSFYLFQLMPQELPRLMMPLGGLPRSMILRLNQELSQKAGGAEQDDTQNDPCFSNDPAYRSFLDDRVSLGLRPKGVIRSDDGRVVGEHEGLHLYSIGQKEGVPINSYDRDKMVVVAYDTPRHALIVGEEKLLFRKQVKAVNSNWVRPLNQVKGLLCSARLSANSPAADCRVTFFESGRLHVEFNQPQKPIIPGGAIVFYDGTELLGGAWIEPDTNFPI